MLSKHASAEDAPQQKVNKALMNAEPKHEEEVEDDEEQKSQAELRLAQDQLQKCLAHALMSAEACSQRNHGRSKADSSRATATGQGSQPATGLSGASIPLDRGGVAKRVEKEDDETQKR